jgi:flagellar hook-associated protein 2
MSSFDIPSISFSGLSSGLDTSAIIGSLVEVRRLPIYLLQKQVSGYEDRIKKFDTFKTRLKEFKTAAENLKKEDGFDAFTASLSEEGILTASASAKATPGAYTIEVTDLATFEQEASGNFADKGASFGSGTIQIDVGGTITDVTIDAGSDTMDDIAAAINASDAEVTATVINDGSDTPYRLVITGDNTGEDYSVEVDTSGLSGGTETLGSFTELQSASDAHFTINNITMQRSTNQVDDAIEGLTLSLTGSDPGNPITLTVERDTSEVKSKIKSFVDAYNSVINFINSENKYDESKESGGVLQGDSTLRMVQQAIQTIFIPSKWDNDPGAPEIQILAQIGIEFDNDGTFKTTDSELEEAINENFDDVVRLFTDSEIGFAVKVDDYLTDYTKFGGFIDGKKDALQSVVSNLEDRITAAEDRLDSYEAGLVKKYAALESLMTGLQTQQSVLYGGWGIY